MPGSADARRYIPIKNVDKPLVQVLQLVHNLSNMKTTIALRNPALETINFCQTVTPGPKIAKKHDAITTTFNTKKLQSLMLNLQVNIFCCALLRLHEEICARNPLLANEPAHSNKRAHRPATHCIKRALQP